MEFQRLGTPPKERTGEQLSATNCTCPDIFLLSGYGLPEVAPTAAGTAQIALSQVVDTSSLALPETGTAATLMERGANG